MNTTASPIAFERVSKRFGSLQALRPVSLEIGAGEFLTLLGPSGSGKTTLLNIIAGYLAPDTGRILVGGRDITAAAARRRNIGMVFQNYALFPHLSVFENVAYGLRVRRVPQAEIRRRVEEALAMVQLDGLGDRAIRQLSGGQQQRVALARALVIEPDLLLMDEPLGALDRQLRKHVQLEIRRLQHAVRRTTIYVTHDQEEALVMSDRIGVMNQGRLEQVGTPRALYEHPVNAFVASFLGESNLLYGRVVALSGDRARLEVEGLDAPLDGVAAAGLREGTKAACLVRPEAVAIGEANTDGFPARVEEAVYLGELVALRLCLPNGIELWSRRLAKDEPLSREAVRVNWQPEEARILPLSNDQAEEEKRC